jgi:RNA polymerase sigma-70 factor (ECF subfamily)
MHDIEGHEHEEIARMLGCSVGTSKSQLHKARMKLRDLLRQQNVDQKLQTKSAKASKDGFPNNVRK